MTLNGKRQRSTDENMPEGVKKKFREDYATFPSSSTTPLTFLRTSVNGEIKKRNNYRQKSFHQTPSPKLTLRHSNGRD